MTEHQKLWDSALEKIHEALANANRENEYNDWFRPIVFESFDVNEKRIILQVPSSTYCDKLDKQYLRLLAYALVPVFGKDVRIRYRIVVDKQNNLSVTEEQGSEIVAQRSNMQPRKPTLPPIDSQLDMHLNFRNYIEGESNKLSRSVGVSIAEHPRSTKFNPMFVFGSSGVGKTHLINAIGVRTKELYPNLRVLYVSARIFQQQYTTAVQNNTVNDFIAFYQTIDVLICDDIQEWAGLEGTQKTFFHIFDDLFRHGKRIILSSDRSPSQLRGMHERLITRFSCGVTTEVERPNPKLSIDILHSKISRDGLTGTIPDDVVMYIAETVTGSVRDLQGVINSLMAYSISGNVPIDIKLAEKIVHRIVNVSEAPVSIDFIIDGVIDHFNATSPDIMGKSRKKEFVQARQIVMYLAQKLTGMPASRIGRLIGGRDHSTVIHSCRKVEEQLKKDKSYAALVNKIEKELKDNK